MICEVADTHGSVAGPRIREFAWSQATFKMDAKEDQNGKKSVKNQISLI